MGGGRLWARPPRTRPRRASGAVLRRAGSVAPAAWVAWRFARAGHWSTELQTRHADYARYWRALAQRRGDIPWVAIGDATAQGIGAPDPSGSYVGQLERMLGASFAVTNLSLSGARLSDVVETLLPRLSGLDTDGALVTFAAGAGDIVDFDPARFRRQLTTIFDALPAHALVADIPSFYLPPYQARVREANRILGELADARDLAVVPLFAATDRRGAGAILTHHAPDVFHPNARGYRLWAQTFLGPARARVDALNSAC